MVVNKYFIVKKSRLHGSGGFAKKNIPKGTRVIEYVGKKINKKEGSKISSSQVELAKGNESVGAVYVFELNKKYDIDGNVSWNPARFINHSCDPNCEVDVIKGKIWIDAIRDIKKGEELFYDYGYDLSCYEEHPCRCRAKNCAKYIVAEKHRKKLAKLISKKK